MNVPFWQILVKFVFAIGQKIEKLNKVINTSFNYYKNVYRRVLFKVFLFNNSNSSARIGKIKTNLSQRYGKYNKVLKQLIKQCFEKKCVRIYWSRYSRMDQIKFVEKFELIWFAFVFHKFYLVHS